ncbi:MAG TPA: hypothetical protein VGV40_11125 [Solirubrobacteraceae bacterium]|nr:hypothetical protein [Solirubrobacteraceae bacterium]
MLRLLHPEPEPEEIPPVHVQVGEGRLRAPEASLPPARDAVLALDGDLRAGVLRVELAGAEVVEEDAPGSRRLSVDVDVVGAADQTFWCLAMTAEDHGATLSVDATEVDLAQRLNEGEGEAVGDEIVAIAVAHWAKGRLSALWTYDWPGGVEGGYLGRQLVKGLAAQPVPEALMSRILSRRVSRMAAIGLAGAAAAFFVGCGGDEERVCVTEQQRLVEDDECEDYADDRDGFGGVFFWYYGGRVVGSRVAGGRPINAADVGANRAAQRAFKGTSVRGSASTVA